MNDHSSLLSVRVWGEFACWTRPDMKVERVTYPMMTPTAARGVLEAIFWKPEFVWDVRRIDLFQPVRYLSLTRNEVAQRASGRVDGFSITEARTQRHALILRDVDYVIYAMPILRAHASDDIAKYRDQFHRRLERGACAYRPYLGTREFSAFFGPPRAKVLPLNVNFDVGPMPLSIAYPDSDQATVAFEARVEGGTMTVPPLGGR